MRLITAHRILIAAAIAFAVFYASFQLRRHLSSGAAAPLVQAAVAAAVAVLLLLYYRGLARRWNRRS